MEINIKRIDNAFKLEATNARGDVIQTDASEKIGGSNAAYRPMELLLVSVATCSSIDVILILQKQRQTIDSFDVKVLGDREADKTPAPFTKININFILSGKIKPEKIESALQLTKTKYCSVLFCLDPKIEVDFTYELT